MNDSGRKLRALTAMNNLELSMTWKTTIHGLSIVDTMNNSGL